MSILPFFLRRVHPHPDYHSTPAEEPQPQGGMSSETHTDPHKQQHLSVPCGLHNATSVHKWSGRCLITLSLSSPRLLDHCVLRRHARPEAQNGWPAVGEGTLWRPHGLRSEQGGKPIFVVSQVFAWHYESKWTNAAWHFCRGLKKAWYKWTCPMACDILHQGSLAPTFVHLILTSS